LIDLTDFQIPFPDSPPQNKFHFLSCHRFKVLDYKCWQIPSDRKGRLQKCYSLTVPIKDIIAAIEKAKKNEATTKRALVRKMRDYL